MPTGLFFLFISRFNVSEIDETSITECAYTRFIPFFFSHASLTIDVVPSFASRYLAISRPMSASFCPVTSPAISDKNNVRKNLTREPSYNKVSRDSVETSYSPEQEINSSGSIHLQTGI